MKRPVTNVVSGVVLLAAVSAGRGDALKIGDSIPTNDVKMTNVDGKAMTLADIRGNTGTLVIFTCNHCPFAKAWQDRMVSLAKEFAGKSVGVAFVNSNDAGQIPEDDKDHMKKLAEEKGYSFPYLADETSVLARAFGATRTPEAFLFDAGGKLVYHGTIDDSAHEPSKVKHQYLKNALTALVAGEKIADTETKSVGCTINFPQNSGK